MTDNESDRHPVEYRGTGFYVSLVFTAIVVIVLLVLALQNTETVQFEFLGWDIDIPLFGIILIAVLLAIVVDEMVGLVWRRSRRRRLSEQQELVSLRQEIQAPASDLPPSYDSGGDSDDEPPPPAPPEE